MLLTRIRHVIPLVLLLALCAAVVPGLQGRVEAATFISLSSGSAISYNSSTNTYQIAPGQTFAVSGSGFTANDKITLIPPSGFTPPNPIQLGPFSTGSFTNAFNLQAPANATNPPTTYQITVQDAHLQSAVVNVQVAGSVSGGGGSCGASTGGATVFVTPTTVASGGTVTIFGSGYTSGATVTLQGGGPSAVATNGNFSLTYTITAGPGTYPITASDNFGHSACVQLVVSGASSGGALLAVSQPNTIAGQPVTITGTGFNTSGTATVSGPGISSTVVNLASNGTFSFTPTISATTATGTYTLSATDNTHTGTVTYSVVNQSGVPALTPSSTTVAPGSTVTFNGSGFSGNTGLSVALTGTGIPAGTFATQNTGGQFSSTITVPTGTAAGTYTITANDGTRSATTTITVGTGTTTAGVAVYATPANATAGQAVTVIGSGFTANAAVTISGAGATATITSSATGTVSAPLTIPSGTAAGSYTVTATDSTGRTGSFTIRVGATGISVALASTSGTPGQGLTVTGTGFTAGEQVTVSLANTATPTTAVAGTTQTFTADGNGNISGTYIVPSIAAGTYAILALGQTSHVQALSTIALIAAVPTATNTPVVVATATPVPAVLPASVSAPTTSIFAEGNTGTAAGNTSTQPLSDKVTFNEKLYLYNPGTSSSAVTTTYYVYPSGATTATTITANDTVAPGATVVRNVNTDVGNDKFVSIEVQSPTGIVAETAISRVRGDGTVLDSDSSTGSTSLQQNWYLAEGYTGASLQEYITLFNPGSTAATAQVSYLPSNTPPPAPQSVSVPAKGRITINVRKVYNALVVHGSRNVAISVTSTAPIAVDRSMYWGDGAGSAKYGYSLGPAISSGRTSQSFPFVPTDNGSQTFVTVLNPGTSVASATLSLRSIGGFSLATSTGSIPAGQRYTFVVPSLLRGGNGDVLGQLTSNVPVVAEASIYFGGSPNIGRHPGLVVPSTLGAATGARAMVAAGGAQLRLFNPSNATERVQVTLSTGGGSTVAYDSTLPANLARTISLPAGTDPRGISIRASNTVEAVLINGGNGSSFASGGNLN